MNLRCVKLPEYIQLSRWHLHITKVNYDNGYIQNEVPNRLYLWHDCRSSPFIWPRILSIVKSEVGCSPLPLSSLGLRETYQKFTDNDHITVVIADLIFNKRLWWRSAYVLGFCYVKRSNATSNIEHFAWFMRRDVADINNNLCFYCLRCHTDK